MSCAEQSWSKRRTRIASGPPLFPGRNPRVRANSANVFAPVCFARPVQPFFQIPNVAPVQRGGMAAFIARSGDRWLWSQRIDKGMMTMRRVWIGLAMAGLVLAPCASAQVTTIDPNRAVDGDLAGPAPRPSAPRQEPLPAAEPAPVPVAPVTQSSDARAAAATYAEGTYKRDDLIAAGEGVFGKGAAGLAGIIERILKDQGQPNAYIAGREASGAFVVGVRYGSGVMSHKVEGQQPVYWTGPSVGFDVGGDANKVFVLVYNLHDSEELFNRFPAAEGRLYLVGGFAATYLRRGNIVLIPVRLGVGWRAGVNIGYMNFTHKSRWLPF